MSEAQLVDGQLPEGWRVENLSEVTDRIEKIDPKELGRPTFKYVDIGSIDSGTNSVREPQHLDVTAAPGRARQLLKFGDSVFSTVRPYLRNIAWIDEDLDGEIASTGFCVIRPSSEKVIPRFLRFYAISDNLLDQVLPLQRGVSYPAVRDKEVLNAQTPVPPLAEQERIVEILEEQLSRLDAALESIRVAREKAAQFRRSLLHAAFTGTLTGHNPTDGQLPEGWTDSTLGEFVGFQNGYAFKSEWYVPDGIRLVRGQNIGHGKLDWSDTKSITPQRAAEFKRFEMRVGEIVLALDRPLISTGLKWAIVQESDLPALLLQRVARFTLLGESLNPKFLQFWIQSPFFTNGINPGRSIGVPHISTKELAGLAFCIPPLAEQEQIVEILDEQLSRLDAALAVADAIEKRSAALRRSLLHAAFTGRLTEQWRELSHV
jgi:type I restriction enzyme S subunit